MKKHLLGALAFAAFGAASASAADLAVKAPVYKAAPVPIVDMWTGFYVGGSVGYGAGGWNASSNQRVFNFENTTANPNVKGVTAGLQAGYNWRFAPQWVVGIEAEIVDPLKAGQVWTDPGLGIPCGDCGPPADFVPRPGGPASLAHEWKLRWFGTVRARLGVTPVENWLLYVTGGPAVGGSQYSFTFAQPGAAAIPAPTNYALRTDKTTYRLFGRRRRAKPSSPPTGRSNSSISISTSARSRSTRSTSTACRFTSTTGFALTLAASA